MPPQRFIPNIASSGHCNVWRLVNSTMYIKLSFDGGLDFESICFLKLGRPNTPGP